MWSLLLCFLLASQGVMMTEDETEDPLEDWVDFSALSTPFRCPSGTVNVNGKCMKPLQLLENDLAIPPRCDENPLKSLTNWYTCLISCKTPARAQECHIRT
ncbi:uncharacterized protein LOC126354308 [Schistocerca gregaria]|uniref:uncharacterized protein LOC126354308 n=1 Tax=Schistocerca gregaria TaxID=7010 RepID=UPI00211E9541|nr:uncharacterized protein LOC126354308 [Schistocerca gregaria]